MQNLEPLKKNRKHLPDFFDPESKLQVEKVIQSLINNTPADFATASTWYELFSELSDSVNEAQTKLDLLLSLDIKNEEHTKRVEVFEKNILSQLIQARAPIMDIYLKSPWRFAMHSDDAGKIAKEIHLKRRYASPEIANLQLEENALIRDFKTFMANSTSVFFGRQLPLGVIVGKFNDPRAEIRKEAFICHWHKIKESRVWLEELFTQLVKNRIKQAEISGAKSYTELCFTDLGRFDYGAKECEVFRESILNAIVPLVSNLQSKQLLSLNSQTLRPWDISIWPRFVPSEQPCQGHLDHLLDAGERIFSKIHEGFGRYFSNLRRTHAIDIHPRATKAPGAFCVVLPESNTPYVFGNFAGHFKDAFTLIHEFGHALHGSAALQIKNPLTRHPGLEFCEVASMGLEFLAQPYLNEFWPRTGDAQKAWALHCFNALQFWPFMAMIDEWQHSIYSEKMVDPRARNQLWKELSRKYRPNLDWSGIEEFEELGWVSRPHPITAPFYYIDYGIAQLGAVQLWLQSKKNYPSTVENYIRGLSLGAQRSLPDLFLATGLEFNFAQPWVERIGRVLFDEIDKSSA